MKNKKRSRSLFSYIALTALFLNLVFFSTVSTGVAAVGSDTLDKNENITREDARFYLNGQNDFSRRDTESYGRENYEEKNLSAENVYEVDRNTNHNDKLMDQKCGVCDECPNCDECIKCTVCIDCVVCNGCSKEDKKDLPEAAEMGIKGYKYLRDTQEGLEGWEIVLENSKGEVVDISMTDFRGYYEFSDLGEDTYLLYEKNIDGWNLMIPEAGSYTIDLDNKNYDKNKLYNFHNAPGIGGKKIYEQTKTGIAGWKIYLQAEDGSTWETVKETVTGETGYYFFTNIESGKYRILEESRDGWIYVEYDSKVIEFGDEPIFVDFHNKKVEKAKEDKEVSRPGSGGSSLPLGKINISKYKDIDGLASTTDDRRLLNEIEWEFKLTRHEGGAAIIKSTSNGLVQFDSLLPGTYTISEEKKEGWLTVYPENGSMEVKVSHGDVFGLMFINHRPDVKGEEAFPVLTIEKSIIFESVFQGDREVPYKVVVRNIGNLTAYNVVVTDILPEGLTHADNNTLTKSWEIGDIKPGDFVELNFPVNVSMDAEPKQYINIAEAIAANHEKVTDDAVVIVKAREGVLPVTGMDRSELAGIITMFLGFTLSAKLLRRKYVDQIMQKVN